MKRIFMALLLLGSLNTAALAAPADSTISALPTAPPLSGNEVTVIVKGGVNYQAQLSQLVTSLNGNLLVGASVSQAQVFGGYLDLLYPQTVSGVKTFNSAPVSPNGFTAGSSTYGALSAVIAGPLNVGAITSTAFDLNLNSVPVLTSSGGTTYVKAATNIQLQMPTGTTVGTFDPTGKYTTGTSFYGPTGATVNGQINSTANDFFLNSVNILSNASGITYLKAATGFQLQTPAGTTIASIAGNGAYQIGASSYGPGSVTVDGGASTSQSQVQTTPASATGVSGRVYSMQNVVGGARWGFDSFNGTMRFLFTPQGGSEINPVTIAQDGTITATNSYVGPASARIAGHINQFVTGQLGTTLTLAAGVVSFTFPIAFVSPPVVVCNPEGAASGFIRITAKSATAFSIASSVATDTNVVDCTFTGNPN